MERFTDERNKNLIKGWLRWHSGIQAQTCSMGKKIVPRIVYDIFFIIGDAYL